MGQDREAALWLISANLDKGVESISSGESLKPGWRYCALCGVRVFSRT